MKVPIPKWLGAIIVIAGGIILGILFSMLIAGCSTQKHPTDITDTGWGKEHNEVYRYVENKAGETGAANAGNPMGMSWRETRSLLTDYYITEKRLSPLEAAEAMAVYDYWMAEIGAVRDGDYVRPARDHMNILFNQVLRLEGLSDIERRIFTDLHDAYLARNADLFSARLEGYIKELPNYDPKEIQSLLVYLDIHTHSAELDEPDGELRDISLGTWGVSFDALAGILVVYWIPQGSTASTYLGGAGVVGLMSAWYKEYLKWCLPWHF